MPSRKELFWRGRNFKKMQLSTCRSLLRILGKSRHLLPEERVEMKALSLKLEYVWDEWDGNSQWIKEGKLLALGSIGKGARGKRGGI